MYARISVHKNAVLFLVLSHWNLLRLWIKSQDAEALWSFVLGLESRTLGLYLNAWSSSLTAWSSSLRDSIFGITLFQRLDVLEVMF